MSKDYFQFKQFTVRQDRCAMKVGTDGTLLGAWARAASGQCHILDIGTGTGLIALMMAQRFPDAQVVGIDIDEDAAAQARENVLASPFAGRITIRRTDVRMMDGSECFEAIVCNPPFFADSLPCPDKQRNTARHTDSLTYRELILSAYRLLTKDGFLSVIIPSDCRSRLEAEARLRGFFVSRVCSIRTTPRKTPKRCLIEFSKPPVAQTDIKEGVIEDSPNVRSPWYISLTEAFYL